MKFLADENVEWTIILFLRQEGHDVKSVIETLRGGTDEEILRVAFEEDRILL